MNNTSWFLEVFTLPYPDFNSTHPSSKTSIYYLLSLPLPSQNSRAKNDVVSSHTCLESNRHNEYNKYGNSLELRAFFLERHASVAGKSRVKPLAWPARAKSPGRHRYSHVSTLLPEPYLSTPRALSRLNNMIFLLFLRKRQRVVRTELRQKQ